MNAAKHSMNPASKFGVAAIFFVVVVCSLIVAAVLTVQGSIRRQMRWSTELSASGLAFATEFVSHVRSGDFEKAREVAAPSFRATLTDSALLKLQSQFGELTLPPATANWRMQKGQTRFGLGTNGFVMQESPSVLMVSLGLDPTKDKPEEIAIDVTYESDKMVITNARRGTISASATPAATTSTTSIQATLDTSIRR
jgi:hypothetical protein